MSNSRAEDPSAVRHSNFMGTGSCASSVCHGSVTARKGSPIFQNEFVTWQKRDKHSKAWTVLLSEEGKKIGANLGIEHPEKSAECLTCHAVFNRATNTPAPEAQLQDGVGCEGCHGAAEKFLKTHTEKGATHEDNIKQGMADIVAPSKRAKLCLSCHLGEGDTIVSHRIMGAGHPRITFELDTFGIAQPHHWIVDEDYIKRKAIYSPVKAWLVGQAIRASEMVRISSSEKLGKVNGYPELTTLYCYNCHHSLAEKQFKKRDYQGRPGELKLNISSLLVITEALTVLSPEKGAALKESISSVHEKEGAEKIRALLAQASSDLEAREFTTEEAKKLFFRLAAWGTENRYPPYEVAEQIAMGLSALQSAIDPSGKFMSGPVTAMYAALKTPESFDPAPFVKALQRIR